ncbi:MAG: M16 family metallopeptidase [Candidatus Glassbacteria bacterium]
MYKNREFIGEGFTIPAAPFYRAQLPNGTTVIVKVNHRLPVIAMDCWVKTGTVNEERTLNGISHFYEHMFFKGTEKHPLGELDRLVKEMGGYNNAATSNEYTHYYIVLPGSLSGHAVELLADAIYNGHFVEEDIDRERMVVKEEINRAEDDPASKLYTLLFENCFSGTPYAMPVLGKKESLDRVTSNELEDYHRKFYVPENITVVISGDVDPDEALEVAEEHFGAMEGRSAPGWAKIEARKPESVTEAVVKKDVKQVYLALGFLTDGFISDRNAVVALDVAASALGEGRSSRLHQELVEKKKLAVSIGTWNWDMRAAGVFWIDAILRPDKIEEAERAIFDELDRFLEEGATEWEMGKVKSMIKADQLYDLQGNAAIAGLLGFYETDFDDASEALAYLKMVEEVNVDRLHESFAEIYDKERFVKTLIVPAG